MHKIFQMSSVKCEVISEMDIQITGRKTYRHAVWCKFNDVLELSQCLCKSEGRTDRSDAPRRLGPTTKFNSAQIAVTITAFKTRELS